ncbi:U-box domain-containing protein 11-like [Rosa rugosa]|uniref:U-box domain-containing protein 11-like n=1 Tax=Rosa rugosa TaxID=74645 RepID=UPI002B4035BE|nr:U-box domain-containing protein 11-like [Rosa rugosa]
MAGGASELLQLVNDVVGAGKSAGGGGGGAFRKDCTDLVRRIALLTHLFEEIRNFKGLEFPPLDASTSSSCSTQPWVSDLVTALQAAKRLVLVATSFNSNCDAPVLADEASKRISFHFQCATWKLERALGEIPYDQFEISEEVEEQVALVRAQLRRAIERYGTLNTRKMSFYGLPQSLVESGKWVHVIENNSSSKMTDSLPKSFSADDLVHKSQRMSNSCVAEAPSLCSTNETHVDGEEDMNKKPDATVIPDFICPISLELMRDPVIVATGQTYERSYIQRWIDCGNTTCPKTQQKLQNLTLTPNYVLRSLVAQWCIDNNIEQPTGLTNGKLKKSDGSFRDISGDIATIRALVSKLAGRSIEERRAAAAEIRSLSKRSTDNRILIAEAGAIPVLVNLLTVEDGLTQENAVTSILNLSIYENNKGLIMLAGAVPSIVQVLRAGSMEARENAAATIFSLSLADENKIIIGASGAISALVELLQNGSTRGKKDAATALFNLCIYQGNKGRAIRAGIITALLKMLTDSSNCMVDEALTIMSVLANHQEAKVTIVKAGTIPVLIDLLRTGLPRNKENASAILLALCKRETENLACLSRLGAVIPLTELTKSGTERAKRKSSSLLEHLRKLQQL